MSPLAILIPVVLALTTAAAPPPAPPQLTVLAGGDVTLGYHLPEFQEELRRRGADEATLVAYPFARIAETTRAADLFLINLEGTLTTAGEPLEKSYNFRADPDAVAVLQSAGVDVVSLANNHAFDFGAEGLDQTRATLLRAGIAAFGAGRDLDEARRPAILERQGVRVGFLGYLYMGQHTIEPAEMYAGPGRPGIAGTHKDLPTLLSWIDQDVRALRPQVDLLIVSLHGGRESRNLTEPYQRRIAATAVAAGADILVGHHPHTLQSVQRIDDSWAAYSLGNLMFAGNWNPRRKEAALLEITWQAAGEPAAGEGSLGTRILPLALDDLPGEPFQPRFLQGEDAAAVLRLIDCYATAGAEGACEAAAQEEAGTAGETPEDPGDTEPSEDADGAAA